jgi:tetratricopeptide (TPR) repeat protein
MQPRITKAAAIALIALILMPMLATAASTVPKHIGIFTKPLPPTPTGWKQFVNDVYAETLSYSWTEKDAHKSDMRLHVTYYQRAWTPGKVRAAFRKAQTFAVAGKKRLAELEKMANDKPSYKRGAKVPYFTSNSTIGPWKMRTYVRRHTYSGSGYAKDMVRVVLYQPGKDAWVDIGFRCKSPSFPPNTIPEWFVAREIQNAAQPQRDLSYSPKSLARYDAWTPASAPRWKRIRELACKKGAEELAKFKDNQKNISANYEKGHVLFMKTLRAFFLSQGIDAPLNPSFFRSTDPILTMQWYHWPKVIKEQVRPTSPLARDATTPPKAKPTPPTEKPTPPKEKPTPPVEKPVVKKPTSKRDIPAEIKTARVLLDAEKWDKTITACSRILAVEPKNDKALWYRGLALVGQKRYPLAVKQFQAAADLQPDNKKMTAYIARVQRLASEQKTATAEMIAKVSKAIDAKQFTTALACSNKAIEINPVSQVARWYKGLALVAMERYAEAYVILDAVAKGQPDNKKTRAYADKIGKLAQEKI